MGFFFNLSFQCFHMQAEVLPGIVNYQVKPGDRAEPPMTRFHADWEKWLGKLQACLFPREKRSGYYRNMEFNNMSAAAIAICLANVRSFFTSIVSNTNYLQADKALLFELAYEDFQERRLVSPAMEYCLTKGINPEAFRLSASLHKDHGSEVCVGNFIYFQYQKYFDELKIKAATVSVTNAESASEREGGLELNIDDKRLEEAWFESGERRATRGGDDEE